MSLLTGRRALAAVTLVGLVLLVPVVAGHGTPAAPGDWVAWMDGPAVTYQGPYAGSGGHHGPQAGSAGSHGPHADWSYRGPSAGGAGHYGTHADGAGYHEHADWSYHANGTHRGPSAGDAGYPTPSNETVRPAPGSGPTTGADGTPLGPRYGGHCR